MDEEKPKEIMDEEKEEEEERRNNERLRKALAEPEEDEDTDDEKDEEEIKKDMEKNIDDFINSYANQYKCRHEIVKLYIKNRTSLGRFLEETYCKFIGVVDIKEYKFAVGLFTQPYDSRYKHCGQEEEQKQIDKKMERISKNCKIFNITCEEHFEPFPKGKYTNVYLEFYKGIVIVNDIGDRQRIDLICKKINYTAY